MADDRKTDPAAGQHAGKDATPSSSRPSPSQPASVGAPGLRRDPPIIEGKATEVPAGAAKTDVPDKTDTPDKADAKPETVKPEPSHARPAAPGPAAGASATRPASAPPPARERESGVGAGMAALLGGVAGAVLAIAASMLLTRGDPQLAQRVGTLEQQLRALPSVDSAALTKRLADLEAQSKTLAGQAQAAADSARGAAQAAADASGVARQAQGLATAAAQTGDANKTAIAALPKPAPVADLGPLSGRVDQTAQALDKTAQALDKAAADARAAQAAAADRIAKLEARPVVTLDKVESRLGQLEQAAGALKPMQDRLAMVEAAAKEAQAKLDARLASIETASVAATAAVAKATASVDERLGKADQALAAAGQQIAKNEQAVAAAGQSVAQTGQRLGALEQRVAGIDLKPLADRVAALDGRFAPVEAKIAETATAMEAKIAQTTSAVEGAAQRAAATQAQSQATRAAVAADAILRALGSGRPYAAEIATLEAAGTRAEALAPLKPYVEKGAPTGVQLAAEFAPLADQVAAAGAPKPAESSLGDRLLNAAGRIVKVRRIGDATATDATSLAGRIEDSLRRGDVADAMKAFAALPESSRAVAKEFGEKLSARARADEAARSLSREAYAALAQPKN